MATTDVLKLTFCSIEYHESGHYLLVSHEDSCNPIKLHQTAMNKLHRHLVMAFKAVGGNLKEFGDIDCGVIDSHDNMDVYLVICNWAQVWLKIYTRDENNQATPTKYRVQFSIHDNLEALNTFLMLCQLVTKIKTAM